MTGSNQPILTGASLPWQVPPAAFRSRGIQAFAYLLDLHSVPWVTTVFDYQGDMGTLLDDFPPDWIDGVLEAVEKLGWTEGVEYVRVEPNALREMVRLLHPLGGIVREEKPLAEVRPLLITIKGGYALALAEQARRGLPQSTYANTTSPEEA